MSTTAENTAKGLRNSTLFFVTNHYPYGYGESFVENEMPYLVQSFKKVIVLSREKNATLTRSIHGFTCYRKSAVSSFTEKLLTGLYILSRWQLYSKLLREEKKYMKSRNIEITPKRAKQIKHDLIKAFTVARSIEKLLTKEKVSGNLVLYSYWFTNVALAITLVRNKACKIKTITRGHGGDINEFRHASGYLTFRNVTASRISTIAVISNEGVKHLKKFIDESWHARIVVSHLGTHLFGLSPSVRTSSSFVLLSCSAIIPVKQIDYIIQALALVNTTSVHWVHIGDGPLRNEMETLAAQLLKNKSNITFVFEGQKDHNEVMQFYHQNYVDAFVNASSSEGLPVSIIEANSFSVPVIAYNVGGVGDIVNEKTGVLLYETENVNALAAAIQQLAAMPEREMKALRQSTFNNWKSNFHADVAYGRFLKILEEL